MPSICSRLCCCDGVSSSSRIKSVASRFWTSMAISATLPRPRKKAASGFSRRWMKVPTMVAPAVSARRASSAIDSSTGQSVLPQSSPASRARSSSSSVDFVLRALNFLLIVVMRYVRLIVCSARSSSGPTLLSCSVPSSVQSPVKKPSEPTISPALSARKPMAAMQSKRRRRSDEKSGSLRRVSPLGCVWIQRMPVSLPSARRDLNSGKSTVSVSPTDTCRTLPRRFR